MSAMCYQAITNDNQVLFSLNNTLNMSKKVISSNLSMKVAMIRKTLNTGSSYYNKMVKTSGQAVESSKETANTVANKMPKSVKRAKLRTARGVEDVKSFVSKSRKGIDGYLSSGDEYASSSEGFESVGSDTSASVTSSNAEGKRRGGKSSVYANNSGSDLHLPPQRRFSLNETLRVGFVAI